MAAAPENAEVIERIQEPYISCVSGITQAGALAALRGPQECVAEMREAYRARRDVVAGLLADNDIDVEPPGGAFYQMMPLAPGADSRLAAISLVDRGVAVAPGSAFGRVSEGYLRLSLARSEPVLRDALERITTWYRETAGFAPAAP